MKKRFKGKYLIGSMRRARWDYRTEAAYFVTAITKNRKKYFGDITDGKMTLSEVGKIAEKCIVEIPLHHENITIGEYVVMPDHIHLIIKIGPPNLNAEHAQHQDGSIKNHTEPLLAKNRFQNIGNNSLSSVMSSCKSSITRISRKHDHSFQWQRGYHEIIIPDKYAFIRISNYIRNNPANWGKKKHNKSRL